MTQLELLIEILGLTVVGAPFALVVVLGLSTLIGHPLPERLINKCVPTAILIGLVAALSMLVLMLAVGTRQVPVDLGNWVAISHYHFAVKFVFDRLSVPFVILSFGLCGTIGAFASKYMHRERGFNRFFVLYALFVLGMVITSLAGTIETLFTGWELVGLSSAMLVAFYQERPNPVRNGLRVWCVYRVSDAALLIAAVVMHHLTGEGDFATLLGGQPWPSGNAVVSEQQALAVGLLLLVAAAGKSALVPFSGWLPRAMEGPTPSSAVFYGALSVHLGAFLLLRAAPLINVSLWLAVAVVAVGSISVLFSAYAGRVQTDIKSSLCFASLTQVGIIVVEIGVTSLIMYVLNLPSIAQYLAESTRDSTWLQWLNVDTVGRTLRYLTLIHILGHGCLRTLQFVRAPTLLYDYRLLENALGAHLPRAATGFWGRLFSENIRPWFYRFALERGYLDAWLVDYLVNPVLRFFEYCDLLERRWTSFVSGEKPRGSAAAESSPDPLDELQ